jgi:chromate transport protein ChrA
MSLLTFIVFVVPAIFAALFLLSVAVDYRDARAAKKAEGQ